MMRAAGREGRRWSYWLYLILAEWLLRQTTFCMRLWETRSGGLHDACLRPALRAVVEMSRSGSP